jgi:hypothetical protein
MEVCKETRQSRNRLHPAINSKSRESMELNKSRNGLNNGCYKGANLIIEDLFFQKPQDLIDKCKKHLEDFKKQSSPSH